MKQEELNEILAQHKLWLCDSTKGERADLSYANLKGENLTDANLTCADLTGANLTNVNLRGADLNRANLTNVNLSFANLTEANLSFADLRGADLDYSCWPLWCGSLGVKADEKLVGQLAYHLLDLAKSSGVDVGICDKIKELANKSSPVTKYRKETIK